MTMVGTVVAIVVASGELWQDSHSSETAVDARQKARMAATMTGVVVA